MTMCVWRVEFYARGRFRIVHIISPTLLDVVTLILGIYPDADFERVVCEAKVTEEN